MLNLLIRAADTQLSAAQPPDVTMTPEMIERFEATTGACWADLVAMGGLGATLTSVSDGTHVWTAEDYAALDW